MPPHLTEPLERHGLVGLLSLNSHYMMHTTSPESWAPRGWRGHQSWPSLGEMQCVGLKEGSQKTEGQEADRPWLREPLIKTPWLRNESGGPFATICRPLALEDRKSPSRAGFWLRW